MTTIDRSAPVMSVQVTTQGGLGQREDVTLRCLSLTFDDEEKGASKLELELDNYDLAIFDDPVWKKGNLVEFAWGYAGRMALARQAVIQKISGFTTIKVEALAQSILMNKIQKSRLFENMTIGQVVAQIAKENGYDATRQIFDSDTGPTLPSLTQARLTDAQFIRSLANKLGFEFFVDTDGFHFHRRKFGAKPVRTFVYFIDPSQGDIISITVENDVTAKPGAVTAKGRDPLLKTDISETANNASTSRDAVAPVLEVVDKQTGDTSLQSNVASEATTLTNAPNAALAKKEADGRYIQSTQTTVMLAMTAIGDPTVGAKQVIEIQNISRRLSGRYYVKGAKHKVSGTEYTMELKCRSDGSSGLGGQTNTKNDGNVNTKDPSDPNALTPKEVVDPRTGDTSITYSQAGGAT
jgi:phage protein D